MDNTIVIVFGMLTGAFVLTLIILRFTSWLSEFQMELKYLNSEIERTSGRERKRWKERKRRLWLSIIPFIKY